MYVHAVRHHGVFSFAHERARGAVEFRSDATFEFSVVVQGLCVFVSFFTSFTFKWT